ncbi:sugar ABC transporter permease [bacterium]|nr:sugar ABC transporter permease [bacterium]
MYSLHFDIERRPTVDQILNLLASTSGISVTTLILSTLAYSSPLILCALGGLFSERSGVINIGLEGKMLAAACATAFVGAASQNAVVGLSAGIGIAIVLSLLHWILTQVYQIDHIISGMGINALALGGTSLVSKTFVELGGKDAAIFPREIYYLAAWVAAAGIWYLFRSTRPGLRIFAVGNDPDKSRQMGLKPLRIRLQSLLMTGVLTGLAGALIATNAGRFSDEMTSGRGYIALAALILGGWKPWPTLLAALAFGFFGSLQLILQGRDLGGLAVPGEFWQALPYLITLIALAGMLGKNRAPAGLGQP